MPRNAVGVVLALVVAHAVDSIPLAIRRPIVRTIARLVARIPGGDWPAAIISAFEFER